MADELQIWGELRTILDADADAPIIHYGSYEPRAVARMGQRYGTDVETYLRRMVNLNEEVFGRLYFPVRSNGLKDIGAFLGASWAEPGASGLQSLVWRHLWEETHEINLKEKLRHYNQDDCRALVLLWDELMRLGGSAASADPRVDFADRPKQVASEVGTRLHEQFAQVLESAHAGYHKTRLTLSPGDSPGSERGVKKRGAKKGHLSFRRILPTHADRTVTLRRRRVCPRHRDTRLQPTSEVAEAFQIDLRSTKNGFKKVVTKFTGARCPARSVAVRFPRQRSRGLRVVYSATASRLGPSINELSSVCRTGRSLRRWRTCSASGRSGPRWSTS